ncbi:MAG: GNAT family N-acetyltransferase [Anaerolineales bacterium]|nr:GNAT family N-acetyltransferase [Anaerolineales bacterium]
MNNQIKVTRIETTQQFENLREEWNTLLFQSPERSVFLTWEWLFAWWKNIGDKQYQLWLLLFHEGERLIGIAPLMLSEKQKYRIKFRRLQNIGNPDCDVSTIISIEPEKTTLALLNYLTEKKAEWDILDLMEINDASEGNQKFLSILDSSKYGVQHTYEEHFYIPLTNDTWDAYYNRLSKNMKHNLKRRTKRISEMGEVIYKKYKGDMLTWSQFETVFLISEKSNFPDLYKTDQIKNFHKDLFLLMQKQQWIQIEILYLNQRPIAFQYGFCFENRYEDWRGGIDKEFEVLAPGKHLMMLSLQDRFQHSILEVDFLRGLHSYKLDWNPKSRTFTTIQIYDHNYLKSQMAYWTVKYILPTLKEWKDKWNAKNGKPEAEKQQEKPSLLSSIKTRLFNFTFGLKITETISRIIMEDSTLLSSIF